MIKQESGHVRERELVSQGAGRGQSEPQEKSKKEGSD